MIKPPPLVDAQGISIVSPSFEEILPGLVWEIAGPVLMTIDKLQTLDMPEAELIGTYRRFVQGWCMVDVPQLATVPLHNFVAEISLQITPFFLSSFHSPPPIRIFCFPARLSFRACGNRIIARTSSWLAGSQTIRAEQYRSEPCFTRPSWQSWPCGFSNRGTSVRA